MQIFSRPPPPPKKKKSTKMACKVQGLQDFLQGLQGARLEKKQVSTRCKVARLARLQVLRLQGLQDY